LQEHFGTIFSIKQLTQQEVALLAACNEFEIIQLLVQQKHKNSINPGKRLKWE
jgi:hypothetical protein